MQPLRIGNITLREATRLDLEYILRNLRESDVDEAIFAGVQDLFMAGRQIYDKSTVTGVYCREGRPVVLFGVLPCDVLSGIGLIWMCATKEIEKISYSFVKHSKEHMFPTILEAYPVLFNTVHCKNELSLKWLEWCGAEIGPASPMGPFGELFHPFTIRRG